MYIVFQTSSPGLSDPERRKTTETKYQIGVAGPEVFILGQIPQHMKNDEALALAAELVANASSNPAEEFQPLLMKAMQSKRRF